MKDTQSRLTCNDFVGLRGHLSRALFRLLAKRLPKASVALQLARALVAY
jgi:hypothetical protein